MSYAICFTNPGTTLTFWLNHFYAGGFIWSLVRSRTSVREDQEWNQPALRFNTETEAKTFIATELAGNRLARVAEVTD